MNDKLIVLVLNKAKQQSLIEWDDCCDQWVCIGNVQELISLTIKEIHKDMIESLAQMIDDDDVYKGSKGDDCSIYGYDLLFRLMNKYEVKR
jgi:hypothetical protein